MQGRIEDQTLIGSPLHRFIKPFSSQALKPSLFLRYATLVLALLFLLIGASAYAADITLAWDPNSEPNLDGYTVYYSKDTQGPPYDYIGDLPLSDLPDPNNPYVTLTDLEERTNYYFALTAYDINGNESSFSSSLCIFIDGVVQECAPASEISGAAVSGGGSSSGGSCFIGSTSHNTGNVFTSPRNSMIIGCIFTIFSIIIYLLAKKKKNLCGK